MSWSAKNSRWRAEITHGGKNVFLGRFDDDAEAAQWAEEDAQAMRMPRYVPVASLGHANGCGFALAMLP